MVAIKRPEGLAHFPVADKKSISVENHHISFNFSALGKGRLCVLAWGMTFRAEREEKERAFRAFQLGER